MSLLHDASTEPSPTDVPLIPREHFFGNPSRTAGRLSPNGEWLSWIAPCDGVLNIWAAPAGDLDLVRVITKDIERPIRQYFWSPDSKTILFIKDRSGNENFLLHDVDIISGEQRLLTPFDHTSVQIVSVSREVKDHILVGLNYRDARWHDVHRLDLRTGKLTQLILNTGCYAGFLVDQKLTVRVATRFRADGGRDFFRVHDNKVEDEPFEQVMFEDSQTTAPLSYTNDGTTLYWLDSRGREMAALVAQDTETGAKTVIGEDIRADIGGAIANPKTGRIEAFCVNYLKNEWVPIDRRIKEDLGFLNEAFGGEIHIISRTDADDKWIVAVDTVSTPSAAYLYDRRDQTLSMLYVNRPELEGCKLSSMHALEIATRDGLKMVSYLTLPPESDPDGCGRPKRALPLVLLVHGGPWGRDVYGYNPTAQWLANRGYAVLSPNFRSSTGFGKRFISAGDLEWGAKMQDDLLDAVDWAVRIGITTSDRVAIMGTSYGGYAALAGLAFTPDKFACGVDIVGPSNLNTLLKTIPPYWEALTAQFYKRMGDPSTAQGKRLLNERSPLFRASEIRRPLLIGQGANDPRVNVAESQQIVDALKDAGIPTTYVVFPDEGHGFAQPQNNIAFNAIIENFLATCIGGRAQPIESALDTSSAEVPHGAEFVPGLVQALTVSEK